MSWRYLAYRLNGDGTETLLSNSVPLQGASITEDLSGPGGITGTISPEIASLQEEKTGRPIFDPWSTAIYAQESGVIRGGAILLNMPESGSSIELDCVGFTGYPKDQYYDGEMTEAEGIQVDPADMVRKIVNHLQSKQFGNLGIIMDDTKTPVRIGKKSTSVEFQTDEGEDVNFESGPYKLAWFQTHDLGQEIDDLAETTPFEYRMEHSWTDSPTSPVRHFWRIGYPTIGRRRHDIKFVVGINIFEVPEIQHLGENYSSEVTVIGAGEGRKMIRSQPTIKNTGRLRRAIVVEDKSIRSKKRANALALNEVKARSGEPDITEFVVKNTSFASLGSYNIGDEVEIEIRGGWGKRNYWIRIISRTIEPETGNVVLQVVNSAKVA